jgi:hypothetical protein
MEASKAQPANQKISPRLAARRSVTTAGDPSSIYFAPLPATAPEASAIKSQFPEAQPLTGRLASESALKQMNAPNIIHIATHGFFLEDPKQTQTSEHAQENMRGANPESGVQNQLLRSGLALAGANLRLSHGFGGSPQRRRRVRTAPGLRFGGQRIGNNEPLASQRLRHSRDHGLLLQGPEEGSWARRSASPD